MLPHIWNRWFRKNSKTNPIAKDQVRKSTQKMDLESLEDRTTPATVDYTLGAWLQWTVPGSNPVVVIGYGFQRSDMTITLEAGETVTVSALLDTSQTYQGDLAPGAGDQITDGAGNPTSANIIPANSQPNFQLYRLGISTTSSNGVTGTGLIGKYDDPGSNFAGFGWAGLGSQNASGYLRSRGFGLPGGNTFDNQGQPTTHFGYLYTGRLIINNPSGTGSVIFSGFDLQTGASGGFTRVSTSSPLTGGGPWGPDNSQTFNVTTGQAITLEGPVVTGAGVFPSGVNFSTNIFDNTSGGGQKLDFTSNPASINSNVINIGTNGEKIYSTKGLSLSSNGRVMDIDNPTGTSTYNLTSNELINVLATGGLNLSSGGAVMNWGSTTGDTVNLISANFGGGLSITNSGNVLFNNTVRFPNALTFTINPRASSDVISNNPNDLDFIIEGGTLLLGPFSKVSASSQQLRNFGVSSNPISVSIATLSDTELLGNMYLYNKANPTAGGQSGTLNVTGPVIMLGALNINVGPNTLNITTNVFRTSDVATVTSNVLNIIGTELRGDAGVEIQPFDPNLDFYAGRTSLVAGAFNLLQSDITTKIISTQYLQLGQAGMLGNFIVSNGDTAGGVLNLSNRGYSLRFLGKTSSLLLNTGLLIANNRRYSINIGLGDVVSQAAPNPGGTPDFSVGGTNGVIDFTSARNVGTVADPLEVTVARLDRSALSGNMDLIASQPAGSTGLEILGQINAGLNTVHIQTTAANSNIQRTNAAVEADIVAGTIELLAGTTATNVIGSGVSPIRVNGDSISAKSGGDIYLAAVTANGLNGDSIDIANSGVIISGGGLTSGNTGRVQISGSTSAGASRATFRLSASELINRTSSIRGSLEIGNNTALDMGRFSETLGVLTGVGFILSDAIQGQAGKLVIDNGVNETCSYAGIISGDVQLVKTSSTVVAPQGAGVLNLQGANTYTGGTLVESGQLTLANNTAIGTGKITLGRTAGAASSVVLSMSNNITVVNPIEIANQFVTIRNESGTNTITAPITFGFVTTIDTLNFNGSPTTLTLSGALSGNQQLFKTGPGNLILSADNNFSGGLQVQAGTLEAQANKALGTGLTDIFSGASFGVRDTNPSDPLPLIVEIPGSIKLRGTNSITAYTSATLLGNGGQILLSGTSSDTATFSVVNATDTFNLLGGTTTVLIDDNNQNVDVLKNGAGVLRLTGINNFDDLTVNNGTVIGVSNQAFGRDLVTVTSSVVGLPPNSKTVYGTVAFDPGLGNTISIPNSFSILGPGDSQRQAALEGLTGTTQIQGNVSINPNAGVTTVALAVAGGAVVDFKGSMTDGGNNLTVQKKGTGRLIFEQANTYGGGTQIDGGEIEVKAQGALGNGTVITNQDTSLIFNLPTGAVSTFANPLLIRGNGLNSNGVIQVTSGTIRITTGEIKLLGNSTISVAPVNSSLELQGKITDQPIAAGQPGGPNAGGPYSLTKVGTGKMILNGGGLTTYRGGTNILDGQVEVVSQNAMGTGLVTVTDGAALLISGTNIILPNNFLLAGKGGAGNPGVIQVTTGGTNATINGGIGLNSDVAFGVVAGSNLIMTNQIDEASGQPGPFGIEKKGQGVMRLEGTVPNLYDGDTLVTAGELQIAKNNALGGGTVVIASGATLSTDSSIQLANKISAVGDGYTGIGAIFARSGLSTFTGDLALQGDTRLNAAIDSRIDLAGKITESKASKITKDGLGTIRVSGSGNAYTGPTQVNAGIVEAASNNALATGQVTVADKATLSTIGSIKLDNSKISIEGVGATVGLKTIGALRSESGANILTGNISFSNSATLSAASGASLELQGVVSESANNKVLTKGDLGSVILSGTSPNTYTGGTQVNEGTLVLRKAGALGDTTINAPATVADKATLAIDAGAGSIVLGNPLGLQGAGADGLGALQALSGKGILNPQAVITLNGDTSLGASKGAVLALGGTIADDLLPAARNLIKVGEGVVRLETTNSYAGTTTVNGGVLVAAASDAFGSLGKLVTVSGGTTLAIEGTNPVSLTNPMVLGGAGASSEGAALRVGVAGIATTAALSGTVGLSSNTVIKVEDKSNATITNVISRDGSAKTTVYLEKTGQGVLTLTAANTYDGGTKITEGKLVADKSNTALSNQPIFVASGATLGLGNVALSNVVNLAVDANIASEANAAASLVAPGNVNAAGNFGIQNLTNSKLTLASYISDGAASGKLTKSGPGELLFQNLSDNQIDGGVDVLGGLFSLDSAKATFGGNLLVDGTKVPATTQILRNNEIADSSKVTLTSGILNLNGKSDTVGGVAMSGLSEIQSNGTLTSTTDFLFSQGKAFANLAGSVGLIKDTANAVLLTGKNTFTGNVNINDGAVEIAGGQAINDTSSLIFGSNGASLIVDNSETIGNLSGTFSGSTVSLAPATTLTTGLATDSTYAGQLIDAGDGTLVKVGTGELTLTGNNKLSTLLEVAAGTLTIGSTDSLGVQNTGPLVIVDPGATLNFNLPGTSSFDNPIDLFGTLKGSKGTSKLTGQITLFNNTNTIDVAAGASVVIANAAPDAAVLSVTLNKTGQGVLGFSGPITLSNPNVGQLNVQAGTVLVSSNNAIDGGKAPIVVSTGATLFADATNIAGGLKLDNPLTLNGPGVAGAGAIAAKGGLTILNSASNLTIATNSTLYVETGSTLEINENLVGPGKITIAGGGKVILNGNSTGLTGDITVSNGELVVKDPNALGTGTVTVESTGKLTIDGDMTLPNNFVLAGGLNGTAGSEVIFTGKITLTGTGNFSIGALGSLDFQGAIGQLGGSFGVTSSGDGDVKLSAVNTFTGPVTVSGPGKMIIANTGAVSASNPVVVTAGTLRLDVDVSLGSLSGAGTVDLTNKTLTLGALNTTTIFAGDIVGAGNLNKVGTGTLTLSGATGNTYQGFTKVGAGTLILAKTGAVDAVSGSSLEIATGATVSLFLPGQINDATDLIVNGGTFNLNANNEAVGTVLLKANGLISGTGVLSTTVAAFEVESGTISANLGGTLGLNKSTVGTVILSGSNSLLSGQVNVLGGQLSLTSTTALNATTPVFVDAAGTVDFGASNTIGSLDGTGKVELHGNTLTTGSFGDSTFTGTLNGLAASKLVKVGPTTTFDIGSNGTLFLGKVDVDSGRLRVNAANTFNVANAVQVAAPGAFEINAAVSIGSIAGAGVIQLNGQALTTGILGSTQFTGTILGTTAGKLVKTGSSTFTLSGTGANTFGGADVQGGTLLLDKTAGVDAIGAGTTTVQTGAKLVLNAADQISNAATVSVNGGEFATGGFKETVNLARLVSGQITGGAVLTSTQAFDLQSGTVNVILAGANGLTKSTAGAVTLNFANPNLAGPVTISGGNLLLSVTGGLNANTPVTFTGAGNLIASAPMTLGALASTGGNGVVQMGANALTISSASDTSFSGIITGTSTLTKEGAGAQTLTGINTYAGPTSVNGGKLILASTGTGITIPGPITVNTSGVLQVNTATALDATVALTVLAGGRFDLQSNATIGSITGDGSANLFGFSLTTGALGSTTFSGNIDGLAAGKLIKVGTSTFTLSGAVENTFGSADVQAGTLILAKTGGANAIGNGSTDIQTGATLSISTSEQIGNGNSVSVKGGTFATNGHNETVANFQLAGGQITGGGTVTSTNAFDLRAGTVNAVLAGANGLAKSTAGIVTLNFANPNLAGTAFISGGDLVLTVAGALNANTPVNFTGAGNLIANAAMTLGALTSTGGNGTVQMGANALTISSATDSSFSGVISGSSTLTKIGAGAQTLTGINTITGPTSVNAGRLILASTGVGTTLDGLININNGGTLEIGTTTALDNTNTIALAAGGLFDVKANVTVGSVAGAGSINLNSSTLTTGSMGGSAVLSGSIAGTAGSKLVKVGSGVLTLSGTTANTFASADVQAGSLVLNKTAGVDAIGAGITTIQSGAILSLSAANQISDAGTISVNGGEFATGGFSESLNLLQLIGGSVTGGGTVTSTQAFDLRAGTVNAVLGGNNGLAKTTAGLVTLNLASPALKGAVTINAGELVLNALTAIGSGNPVSFSGAGILTTNTALNIGALSSTGAVGSLKLGANDLIINAATSSTFGGVISGSGKLTKQGTGTLVFSGANTYTGLTTVSAGTLALAGASNNAVIVSDVTIDGGTLRLDASEQIANDKSITLNSGSLALAGAGSATTETLKNLKLLGGNVTGGVSSVLVVTDRIDVGISNTAIDATLTGTASFNLTGNVNYTVLKPFQVTGPINVLNGTMFLSSPTAPSILTPLTISGPGKVVATLNDQVADDEIVTIDNDGILDIGATNDTYGGLTLTRGTITGTTGVITSASNFLVQGGLVSAILGGSNGLVKTDSAGTVVLTRNNTFTGGVQVQGGTLELAATGNALATTSVTVNGGVLRIGAGASGSQIPNAATVTVSAGTYDLGAIDQTLAVINMTGGEITGATGRLFTSQPNFAFTNGRVSAILAGASTGLIATGTGTVVLANTNQYGGLTTVAGGTLVADANANAIPGNISISAGTLRLNRSNQIGDTATLTMTGGTVDLATAAVSDTIGTLVMDNGLIGPSSGNPRGSLSAQTFDLRSGRVNATLGGSGKLTKSTNGVLTLSGTNNFTGGSDILAGTVNLNALQGGSLPGTTTITGGTVNLQAANQVPGAVKLNGADGILNVASFPNSSQSLEINGGTLTGTSGVYSVTGANGVLITTGKIDAIVGGANGLTKTGTGTATVNKPGQYNGATNINGGVLLLTGTGGLPDGSVVTVAAGAKFDLGGLNDTINGLLGQGTVSLGVTGNNALTLGVVNPTTTSDFPGVIEGIGNLIKAGSGVQNLSGANTFTGGVQVQGGTLGLTGSAASVLPDNAPVLVSQGATLAVNKTETIGALSGQGTANLAAGSELTSSYATATEVQVALLGSGTLRKSGAGNVDLTSNSANFTGTLTLVSAGLKISGNVGGIVSVLGGNLTGTGTAANVALASGTYSPGSSPGIFTVGNLTGVSPSTYIQEINGVVPGTGFDQTIITDGINITGMNLNTLIGSSFKPTTGQAFMMVDNQSSTAVVGTFNGLPEGRIFTVGTTRLQITYKGGNGNDIVLTVPSASTSFGMVLGSPGNTGPQSVITIYNTAGAVSKTIVPFQGYAGALRTAVGDVTGDGVPDIAVVTGVGAVPSVKVLNGVSGGVIYSFLAYDKNYAGGMSVAMGDINGDGFSDIIVGTITSSSHVKIFSGRDLTLLKSYYAFGAAYAGGVNLAAGDFTGDGKADVIVGAATNSSRVVVQDVQGVATGAFTNVKSFYAFANTTIPGGVFVSAADLNGDGRVDILAGSGNGATPQMRTFTGPNATPGLTINMNGNYLRGVRVTIGDLNNDGLLDLIGGAGPGYQPVVTAYASSTGAFVKTLLVYPSTFRGGVIF